MGGEVQGLRWGEWCYFSVVVRNQKDKSVESQSIDCAMECSYTSPQVAEGREEGAISSSWLRPPTGVWRFKERNCHHSAFKGKEEVIHISFIYLFFFGVLLILDVSRGTFHDFLNWGCIDTFWLMQEGNSLGVARTFGIIQNAVLTLLWYLWNTFCPSGPPAFTALSYFCNFGAIVINGSYLSGGAR